MDRTLCQVDEVTTTALLGNQETFSDMHTFSMFVGDDYHDFQQLASDGNDKEATGEAATTINSQVFPLVIDTACTTSAEDREGSEDASTPSVTDEQGGLNMSEEGSKKRSKKRKNCSPCGHCQHDQKKCTPLRENPGTCERCETKGIPCPPHISRKKKKTNTSELLYIPSTQHQGVLKPN